MPPAKLPPVRLTWESLPKAQQQELTLLLATLLTQYLTHKRQTTSQAPQEETSHEPTSQNP